MDEEIDNAIEKAMMEKLKQGTTLSDDQCSILAKELNQIVYDIETACLHDFLVDMELGVMH